MRYMLMICTEEDEEPLGPAELAVHPEVIPWVAEVDGRGLRPPAEGKAVRIRRRQLILSDGPFAETKEQVGGFCLIEAADLDEAIAVAAEHPAATYGTIEVRELWPQ